MTDTPEARIIVVEDDASVRDAIVGYLERQGFGAEGAEDGLALDRLLARGRPDLIILDIMLPHESGLAICHRLKNGPPILVLSGLDSTGDRIAGLELGAADYLGKPFDPRELLARVRAVLRRNASPPSASTACTFDGWRFDPEALTLHAPDGQLVPLKAGELRLLKAFVCHPNRLLTRDRLLDLTHGHGAGAFDRAVDLAVSRLRRRLADAGGGADPIETVRGLGYRFRAQVEWP